MGSNSADRFVVGDCFGGGEDRHGHNDNLNFTQIFPNSDSRFSNSSRSFENSARFDMPSALPRFDQQRVTGKDGSVITFDELDRVTSMRDAANRSFSFQYDRNDLKQVTNEYGTWNRQKHHGHYTDDWKSEDGNKWKGQIEVSPRGYSYTNFDDKHGRGDRTIYSPDGNKCTENLGPDREVFSRYKEDRLGNICNEDLRNGKVEYNMHDGRSAVRDLKDNSYLAYDRDGNLMQMKDAAGRKFTFSDYDSNGKPQHLTNENGSWTRHGQDRWINNETKQSWSGNVDVDKNGVYSYTDLSGRKVTHSRDGQTVTSENGITTSVDKNGHKVSTFADGEEVMDANGKTGAIQFKTVKGETKGGIIDMKGIDVDIVNGRDGSRALIHSQADSAVKAMQEGRVVYSFNHNDKNHRTGNASDMMSAADLATIDRLRSANPDQDMVVMQSYDKQAKGVRYQIYSGLDLASTQVGETVHAGEIIGRAGDNGYTFAARRQKVSGKAVPLSVKGQSY